MTWALTTVAFVNQRLVIISWAAINHGDGSGAGLDGVALAGRSGGFGEASGPVAGTAGKRIRQRILRNLLFDNFGFGCPKLDTMLARQCQNIVIHSRVLQQPNGQIQIRECHG